MNLVLKMKHTLEDSEYCVNNEALLEYVPDSK